MGKEYIITDDTGAVTRELFGRVDEGANARYIGTVFNTVCSAIPVEIERVLIDEREATGWINEKARSILENPNACIITPDRFILEGFDEGQLRRVGMVRTAAGGRASRQGYPTIEDQMAELPAWVADRDVVVVDDGVFTGGTMKKMIEICRQAGVRHFSGVIGVVGNGERDEIEGIPLTVMKKVRELYDWVDARDFSIFGGKMAKRSREGKVATSVPYIAPFSDGSGASLATANLQATSLLLLAAQRELICTYDPSLKLRNLVEKGFPIPDFNTSNTNGTVFCRDMRMVDYIDNCMYAISAH